jgi:hypothetical protein
MSGSYGGGKMSRAWLDRAQRGELTGQLYAGSMEGVGSGTVTGRVSGGAGLRPGDVGQGRRAGVRYRERSRARGPHRSAGPVSFWAGPMNNDKFDLFDFIFQMARMELIKRGPSRSRTNSNKIWI